LETKYDKIGVDYNITRKADRYLAERLFHHLNPTKNGIYLDIGCGTGNYTHQLQQKGLQVIGIDPSLNMLNEAKKKNVEVDWRIGTAEKTNLTQNSMEGIIGFLTIHHWRDLSQAFVELSRVLKTGGKIVLFTSTPNQMKGYWLNHYFPKMLKDSIKQMPSFDTVKNAMQHARIQVIEREKYFIQPDLQDQFLYCGKDNPELYFDAAVRNGISSFSSLANREEVEKGLLALRKDMDSGKIDEIRASFDNNEGDYLFIIGLTNCPLSDR
jgi:ubiquinone/menaquinone biosynthesis C-methylase UbiE